MPGFWSQADGDSYPNAAAPCLHLVEPFVFAEPQLLTCHVDKTTVLTEFVSSSLLRVDTQKCYPLPLSPAKRMKTESQEGPR